MIEQNLPEALISSKNGSKPEREAALFAVKPSKIYSRVDYLIGRIYTKIKDSTQQSIFDENVQDEIANLVNLLHLIEQRFIYDQNNKSDDVGSEKKSRELELGASLDFIEITLESLFHEEPNLCLSRKIRQHIEHSIHEFDDLENRLSFRINYLIQNTNKQVRKIANESNLSEFLFKKVQEEASNLVNLLQSIEKRYIYNKKKKDAKDCDARQAQLEASLDFVESALEALFQEKPNICLSKRIRRHTEYSIHESQNPSLGSFKNFALKIVHLGSTPTKVIFGLGLTLPICLTALVLSLNSLRTPNLSNNVSLQSSSDAASSIESVRQFMSHENLSLITLVAAAGGLGSVVSILTRLEKYQNKEYDDSLLPFFIGAFKPIIGASFGVLLFTLICANVSPIQIAPNAKTPQTQGFTFFSLAFIIGFSERFANDIISRTEGSMSGNSGAEKPKQGA